MTRGGWTEVVRQHPLTAPFELRQAHIGRDGEEPRSGRTRIAQAGSTAPSAQERVLQRIIGVVHRAEHPVAMRMEFGPVTFDDISEVGTLAGSRVAQGCSTTSNVCPLGSRNQNIGGTGSPMRETS